MFIYYLHLAWRRCRTQLAATLLILLTLAIGISACITALTVVSAFEGDPIPGVSPHMYVVTLGAQGNAKPNSMLSLSDATALVNAHRAVTQTALAAATIHVGRDDAQDWKMVNGLLAYGQTLRVLGIPLRFGRSWTVQELQSHVPVVIIDSALAVYLFGTPDVVGRNVKLGSHLFHVIGVTDPWRPRIQFSKVEQVGAGPTGSSPQIFIPVGAALDAGVGPTVSGICGNSAANTTYGSVDVQRCRWMETWVSLNTPVSVSGYGVFLDGYANAHDDTDHEAHAQHARLYGTRAWMAINDIVPDDVTLDALLAGVFLLLCMTNVMGLLTARFLQGRVDTGIRRAMGATRWQVFAQALVESMMLGLSGGVLALPLTLLGMWVVRRQPVGYVAAAHFSPGVFMALLLLSLFVGTAIGLWPAWRICKQSPAICIKQI